MKLSTIIWLFIIFGVILIITNRGYNLTKPSDQLRLVKDVALWLKDVAKNVYDVTMYAIKKPWLPENVSINKTIEKLKELKNITTENNNS